MVPLAGVAETPKIRHIVIVIQENRTPDNLFQGLKDFVPAADIASFEIDQAGKKVALDAEPLAVGYDMSHTHEAFLAEYDHGRMDGWNSIECLPKARCPYGPALKSVLPGDVTPYIFLAAEYGFANRMFQTNQGPSFPAHQ
jgi:phospholipase C